MHATNATKQDFAEPVGIGCGKGVEKGAEKVGAEKGCGKGECGKGGAEKVTATKFDDTGQFKQNAFVRKR